MLSETSQTLSKDEDKTANEKQKSNNKSGRKGSHRNSRRSEEKQRQLRKMLGNEVTEEDQDQGGLDYASAFTKAVALEKVPSEEASVDIFKLRPAPETWNFYSPLPEHKMLELVESVESIGLQNRIIVWQEADKEHYVILAGHNRSKVYEMIYSSTQNEEYRYIPAKIYNHEDLTPTEAKEIIVDTNFVQRSLNTFERARSIAAKINLINERRTTEGIQGRARDIVAERYGLKGRMVENYRKLLDLCPKFIGMVNNGQLSVHSGAKLAVFDKETQEWIYGNFYDRLRKTFINKLKSGMTKDEISAVFGGEVVIEQERTKIQIEIPYGMEKEFSQLFTEWTEKNKLSSKDFKIYVK